MTQQFDRDGNLLGTPITGRTAQVAFGNYQGRAALREREGFTEVAYRGEPPATFPCIGTIDNETAQAVKLRDPVQRLGDLVVLIIR